MFNNNERDNMNNLKIEIIKKLMMLDTVEELNTIKERVINAISRECDADDKNQADFAKWKAERNGADVR